MYQLFLLLLLAIHTSFAHDVKLKHYNYSLQDISHQGHTREELYQKMNRKEVRYFDSICSNRAHAWAWDFKLHQIDSAKIFLFFTKSTSTFDGLSWWYHVVPLINEKGRFWTMDAGYPERVDRSLTVTDWISSFIETNAKCKEINNSDQELILQMAKGGIFPERTSLGEFNCYYRITPPGYWTPSQVARNILSSEFNRNEMEKDDVLKACIEATTNPLGRIMGRNLRYCRYFLSHGSLNI